MTRADSRGSPPSFSIYEGESAFLPGIGFVSESHAFKGVQTTMKKHSGERFMTIFGVISALALLAFMGLIAFA